MPDFPIHRRNLFLAAAAVGAAAAATRGLTDVRILKDYAGLDRILMARREAAS